MKGLENFMKKYKKGYTTGVFDVLHRGHLNILKQAKEQCDYLVVGVTTDRLCFERKNKYPVMPEEDRIDIVGAIRYVDQVVKQENMNKVNAIKVLECDVVFVGSDWEGTAAWKEYEEELKKIKCDVVYIPHTDGISSTILRERLRNLN